MPVPRLCLASTSPRRRDLLKEAGYRFEICPAPAVESVSTQLTAVELVCLNARRKARSGARGMLGGPGSPNVVLGADTLVSLEGEALGKPRDRDEAFEMLSRLAGRSHEVFTGVCLLPTDGERGYRAWVELTRVTFRPLGPGAIRSYLGRINPLDKAGAYAAQEHGSDIIAAMAGSHSNVMGLPMESLATELQALGIIRRAGRSRS